MTQILIDEINYKNFKGLTEFSLTLNGKPAVISGQNGAGKTSLADGFQWLLFGKDTKGAKIDPKPISEDNEQMLGLEPEVEAQVLIDGKTVTLKRVQEEKWTSKRGELEKTRSSDTTKYFIDSVPVKEKEWKAYLEQLGGEEKMQMLSNSAFFMQLNWKNRREILIEMSGLTDEDIIEQDPELKELAQVLDGHTADEMKKILAGHKKEVKKNIDGIPARIQENNDTINRIQEGSDPKLIKEKIKLFENLILETEKKILDAQSGSDSLVYQKELSELELKLSNAKNQFMTDAHLETQSLQQDVNDQQQKVNGIKNQINDLNSKQYRLKQAIDEKLQFRKRMIAEYNIIKNETFDEHATSCPTCGQDLPADQIEHLREEFNLKKSQKLEENKQLVTTQNATKEDLQSLDKELNQTDAEIIRLGAELEGAITQLDLINNDLTFETTKIGKFEASEVFLETSREIEAVKTKMSQSAKAGNVPELKIELEAARANLIKEQAALQEFELVKQLQERISDLKKQDQALKVQNSEIEKKLWMIDEFTRKKVGYLEASINNKFELISFKLFNVLKNGAIEETCEATFNGIEYSSSLNNGARINCDLDIVNTLSKEFGMTMPVFVDNAESVNELLNIDAQMIELQVTEDEKLKVEV